MNIENKLDCNSGLNFMKLKWEWICTVALKYKSHKQIAQYKNMKDTKNNNKVFHITKLISRNQSKMLLHESS